MAATTFTAPEILTAATEAVTHIRSLLHPPLSTPKLLIICGSGLGGLAETIHPTPIATIPYSTIPHFHSSTVPGHAGKLAFGLLGKSKTPVVLMVGRNHFYEGHSIDSTTFPLRTLILLGTIETVLITNAAGGLNPGYNVGDVVLLNDHINFPGLAGVHPLRGPNLDNFGPRFPALSDAYDLALRRQFHKALRILRNEQDGSTKHLWSPTRTLHEGVYVFVSGPTFETRAECRFLRLIGADVVGMSTVPEIIVARHAGVRILALSLVTNCAVLEPTPRGDDDFVEAGEEMGGDVNKIIEKGKANHEEVLESGWEAAEDLQRLVEKWVDLLQLGVGEEKN